MSVDALLLPPPAVITRPAQAAAKHNPDPALRRASEEFESLFLGMMFEHMFSGIKTDGLFGGGHGEKIYRSMMVQEFAKTTSRNGGVGIADSVYREMLRAQEGANVEQADVQ